jgi:hypothetical protein
MSYPKTSILFLSLYFSFIFSGCSKTGYWQDRGWDAADVFTASFGYGAGASARVGPLVGPSLIVQFDQCGLRGGDFFARWGQDLGSVHFLLVGGDTFYSDSDIPDIRKKEYSTWWFLVPISLNHPETHEPTPLYYFTQIEATVALGGSIRLGFNPGELVDLLSGILGYDLYKDDLSKLTGFRGQD